MVLKLRIKSKSNRIFSKFWLLVYIYIYIYKSCKFKLGSFTCQASSNLFTNYLINLSLFSMYIKIITKMFYSRLSILYRTDRYGRNIPYWLAIRYTRPPYFVPEKIPAVPASYRPISGNTSRYRAYQPIQKKVFFFF